MLVLSRKVGEEIYIDGNIRIAVVDVRGDRVRLGITAPKDVNIWRKGANHKGEQEVVLEPRGDRG